MKIGENSKSEQINNQLSVSEQQSSSKMKIKNTSHQTISLGNTAFASIREANSFYIDKTDFIRQWWESQDVATLITRPRRFGKSLNLNMLECLNCLFLYKQNYCFPCINYFYGILKNHFS